MPPTVPHILLTASGLMPGGDTWSCGLRSWRTTTPLGDAGGPALALAVANRWMDFRNTRFDLFGSVAGSEATIGGVVIRELNGEGITTRQYEAAPTTAKTGGTGGQAMPNQAAVVVSLVSSRAGRTGKGRFYVPAVGLPIGTLLADRMIAGQVSAIVTSVKTLLDGINTDLGANPGGGVKLAIQSATAAAIVFDADGSLAEYDGSVITGFRVGNVIDTQRRRRSSVAETYTTASLA
jgi:hypothetical protein